jgi:hypothetical protein
MRIPHHIIITSIVVFLTSCEKVIDMDINKQDSKLVVISYLNPDSIFEVHLSKSISILDQDSVSLVRNANVFIYENNIKIDSLPFNALYGTYKSNGKKPIAGNIYRIDASAEGYKDVSVECTIPVPVAIIKIDTFANETGYSSDYWGTFKIFNIGITINDPGDVENFYIISIPMHIYPDTFYFSENWQFFGIKNALVEYASNSLLLEFWKASEDNGVNSNDSLYRQWVAQAAFSDQAFNGKNISFDLEIINNIEFDSIRYDVVLTSVNKDYIRFIASEALYKDSEGPFTEKVQMYNNINGGFGIVLGSSSIVKSFTRYKNWYGNHR